MVEPEFSLDQLYRAIEAVLRAQLPGLETVEVFPDIRDRIALPALFLEVAEFEPGQDPGTGETALELRMEARIIMPPERRGCHGQAVQLASQLAVLLRGQTWGLPVEPAAFTQSGRDWTKPELDGYEVWLVEWTQQVYLGAEEWPWPDEPPGTLRIGIDPDSGQGNEGQYLAPEELE